MKNHANRTLAFITCLTLLSSAPLYAAQKGLCDGYLIAGSSFDRSVRLSSILFDRKQFPTPRLSDIGLKPGEWLSQAEYEHLMAGARQQNFLLFQIDLLVHQIEYYETHSYQGDDKLARALRVDFAREALQLMNSTRIVDPETQSISIVVNNVPSRALFRAVINLAESGIELEDARLLQQTSTLFADQEHLGLSHLAYSFSMTIKNNLRYEPQALESQEIKTLVMDSFVWFAGTDDVVGLAKKLDQWRVYMGPWHFTELVKHFLDTQNPNGLVSPLLSLMVLAKAPKSFGMSLAGQEDHFDQDELRIQKVLRVDFQTEPGEFSATRHRMIEVIRKFLRRQAIEVRSSVGQFHFLKFKELNFYPTELMLHFLGRFGFKQDLVLVQDYLQLGKNDPLIFKAAKLAEERLLKKNN